MSVIGRGGPSWGSLPAAGVMPERLRSRAAYSGGSTIACAASFWRTRNAASRFA